MPNVVTHAFEGLVLKASVGLRAAEKAAPQRIVVDLEYDCPETPEPSDEIASVLDYDGVRQAVAAIVENVHFNLLETLCRRILTSLLARPEVIRAKVSVKKPDIYEDVDAVGVTMEASKR